MQTVMSLGQVIKTSWPPSLHRWTNIERAQTTSVTSFPADDWTLDPLLLPVLSEASSNLVGCLTRVQVICLSRLASESNFRTYFHLDQTNKRTTVRGIVVARNSHQSDVTVSSPFCPLKNAIPKKLEIAVAGRKTIVRIAIIFIAELSCLVA